MPEYAYETCCIDSTAEAIQDMIDRSREVTYRTLVKHVGRDKLAQVFPTYDWRPRPNDLTLRRDYHVGYYRSVYQGKPCYYVVHSAIEYIFTTNPRSTM